MSNEVAVYISQLTDAQRQRINNGVKLLDSRTGFNWAEKVDTKTLDINSFQKCVLCHVFGSYQDGLYRLQLATDDAAREYGFYPHKEDQLEGDSFTDEAAWHATQLSELKNQYWAEIIRQRQQWIIEGEIVS